MTERADVAVTQARRNEHVPGEEGTWVFIFGDMLIFAAFFLTYLYYRGQQSTLFDQSQELLDSDYGVANTILLLCSSLLVVMGMRAVRTRRTDSPPKWFAAAFVFGVGFACLKIVEYHGKLSAGITPQTNDFFMYYYLLTGLHLFHLLLGLGVLAALIRMSSRPIVQNSKQMALAEGGACYWHMVDLLWIVLFPLIYLVR